MNLFLSMIATLFVGVYSAHLPVATIPSSGGQTRVAKQATADQPIGIVRSSFLPQVDGAFEYSFESENGIKQQAVGSRKAIGEDGADVIVMKGSYEYIGADGEIYTVEWEADENGYRASAPHLPKSVPIPFPEQQAAVDAQLRFAAEEEEVARKGKSVRQEAPVLAQRRVVSAPAPVAPAPAQADYADYY